MVTLRLFHSADPFRPLETRTFEGAELTIGRDPAADWHIEDPACELSRRHCSIRLAGGRLLVRDTSANGVFFGDKRQRIGRDHEVDVALGETLYLGQFIIATAAAPMTPANDHDADVGLDAPFHLPMLREPELSSAAFEIKSNWVASGAPSPATGRVPDAALLEAFCEGAGLDPSMFMSEDATEVMRRAGSVYRQAVVGLSDLMGERTSLKSAYHMDRTTVGAADNNPFKWADAHRVAVDLLKSRTGPFLAGGSAVTQSFQDLKKHLLCLMAGSRAALAAALDELSPDHIGQEAAASLFQGKAESNWREYLKRHEKTVRDARESNDSAINRAFTDGYERHVRKLEGLGTAS